jgi:glycosyltransferase involved in cell wall biosynthesis
MQPAVSVVVPIKDECDNLRPLCDRLGVALAEISGGYEIVLVDDGSSDNSFGVMQSLAAKDPKIVVVRLSRNYGQSAAMQAGIDHSQGDVVVTMDGDLQNDPADIPQLISKLDEGYDVVLGRRSNRKDSLVIRKIPSRVANWLIRRITGVPFNDFGCTLRALRRDVAASLSLYGEMHRFVPALAQQGGARITQIDVQHHPRVAGHTKYNLTRTVRVVLDLMTVQFLNRYVTRPMHVFGSIGLLSMMFGFGCLAFTIGMKLWAGIDMTGNPLLLLSVLFALCGVQFLSTGLLGELMARTYFESQGKTPYRIRSLINRDRVTPSQVPLRQAG